MADRCEGDDRDAVSAIAMQPHRKAHSQQLRAISSGGGGSGSQRRSQLRNHSLDEGRMNKNMDSHEISNGDFYQLHQYTGDGEAGECDSRNVLPEFVAGGGTGIFKAPNRAAVHPHRPPAVELRPHPLRETQGGKFLRTIACSEGQLWAGQESGVRFWRYGDIFVPGSGLVGGRVRRGDEDAAPFYESGNTSPTLCLVVDEGNRLVWTGHKDGKIRSWKMDQSFSSEDHSPFKEGLSWLGHRGPILSMCISSYGDLWIGLENGLIKLWPWEAIEKSLSLSPEERHMAALLVERSFIDLRSQVTVNGACNISSSDVKAILSDHTRGKVWCAGSSSFSLWDARTKELIKAFNIEGQIENRADTPSGQEQTAEDEAKAKLTSSSKKDKPQGFLQRSRNAIMGAADAVRRVATRGTGAFNEDIRKTECMVMTLDGMIWTGCSNGMLVQWDGNATRLNDFNHNSSPVLCFCTYGSRLWVGYASGLVQLLDLDGNLLAEWVSHSSPVVKMAVGGGYVFSLATHGGIRAWHLTSPGSLDSILRTELAAKELSYTRREQLKILVGTWNVGQGKASPDALKAWLGAAVSDVGIVVVGLQEVEMGAGFLAMSAAKETGSCMLKAPEALSFIKIVFKKFKLAGVPKVGLEGSALGQWWQDAIGKTLDEGPVFERVGSRQLAALLITIWVRKGLRTHVGDLDVAAVACGLGRTIGNKGGVGLRLRVHDRILCFVNCHLAAHLEAVNRRNADFDHIFRTMVFSRQSNLLNVPAASASTSNQSTKGTNASGGSGGGGGSNPEEGGRPDLPDADMVVFLGDFNYRLFGISYDEARDLVSQRSFDWLREKDQLRAEMKAGKVFQGMREAIIRFPPTYKFERHQPGLGGYDSGEKKRIPAWCDRIIYRDNRCSPHVTECSLECPVIAVVQMYEACMDVTESDHKPVRCKLSLRIARVDRSVRRKEFGEIMKTDKIKHLIQELPQIPDIVVSTENITLQNQESRSLCITNRSRNDTAFVQIICDGHSNVNDEGQVSNPRTRGAFGFPTWLEKVVTLLPFESLVNISRAWGHNGYILLVSQDKVTVTPAVGVISPDQSLEVTVRHAELQSLGDLVEGVSSSWWQDDTKDREAILRVNVRGSILTEARAHRVRVRHCGSQQQSIQTDPRMDSSRRGEPTANPVHYSEKHESRRSEKQENSRSGKHEKHENSRSDKHDRG